MLASASRKVTLPARSPSSLFCMVRRCQAEAAPSVGFEELGQPEGVLAIGFPRTPFLFEIAFANLGLAIMGFRAASASASARERITIGLGGGMFLWGALAGHVYQWFANGDHAPGNTGGVLVNDLLIPAVMIVLAVRSRRLAAATPRRAFA
ncbi:DUF6790 family protein [Amycolatopsis sp. NPDC048633]|uniref:DUF6790 family protein n=1 Tax=Amycolatopsis sp. NPDC048633 TaxID=3157095 RepID=UPI0033C80743